MTDKRKGESWYSCGFREACAGLPSDPPYKRGNRHHAEYVEGFADGERQVERDAQPGEA